MTEKTYVFKFDSIKERDGKWAQIFVEQDGKRSRWIVNGKEMVAKKEDVMRMLHHNLNKNCIFSARPLVDDAPHVLPAFKEGEIQATAFYFPSRKQEGDQKLNLLVELSRDDCLDDENSYQSRLWKMSIGRPEKEVEPVVREEPQSKLSKRVEDLVNKFQDLSKVKKVAVTATAVALAAAAIAGNIAFSLHRENVRKEEARNRYHISVGVADSAKENVPVIDDIYNEDGENMSYVAPGIGDSKEEQVPVEDNSVGTPYMKEDTYLSLRSNIENTIKDPDSQRRALDRLVQQAFTGSTQVEPHKK